MSNWAVIVAAGRGERAGFDINKVFVPVNGVTPVSMCLSAFDRSGLFDGIALVVSENDVNRITQEYRPKSEFVIVLGGKNRQESVFNGLKSISDRLKSDSDIVAIHDAARPYVTKSIIEATIKSAAMTGSGVISTPVTDTIKQISESGEIRTLNRQYLRAVQTPQTFKYREILAAHEKARSDNYIATDDAALYEKYIGSLCLVTTEDAILNKKLTLREDFVNHHMDMRIGHGYDAHRLVNGRKLILCGVDIPYEYGLDGHSDADVAIHALMDAMLGAAALGDIGKLFPPSDEKYLGISSIILLRRVNDLLVQNGYRLGNADITIIAQKPKLAFYIDEMRRNIAEATGVQTDSVSVKATTTEKMGFEGRQEGISTHAVVTVIKEI